MVILHVFWDSKFFCSVSNFFDSLGCVKNLYYYFSEEGDNPFNSGKVSVITNKNKYVSFFSDPNIDIIYFHGLLANNYWLFKYIDKSKIVIWWCFGSEIYYPFNGLNPLVKVELYKPLTQKYMNKSFSIKNHLRKIHFLFRLPYDWYVRRSVISRIDYMTPVLPMEYNLLLKECNYFRAKPFMQNCGPDLPSKALFEYRTQLGNILIGNSKTYSNNHLDIFERMRDVKLSKERKYVIPINYGSDYGSCQSLTSCCKLDTNRMQWITDFIPPSEYFTLFESITHAIFGVIRQQAMGNIFECLRRGIKVYLYKDSIVYKQLKKLGYVIYTIDYDLNTNSLNELLSKEDALKNYNCYMKRNAFLEKEYIENEFDKIIRNK